MKMNTQIQQQTACLQFIIIYSTMDKKITLLLLLIIGASIYMFNQKPSDQKSQLFDKFKVEHRKYYWTSQQQSYRKGVFLKNLIKIEAHNSNPERQYSLGVTPFADLTQQEFASIYLGTKFVPKLENQVSLKQTPIVGQVDWTSQGKVSRVKDQGMCGSCWAFSTTGSIESAYRIVKEQQVELSEQELVDCSRAYGNQGCEGGWMESAFEYVMDKQIGKGSDYQYTGRNQACDETKTSLSRFSIQSYKSVKGCDQLKNALSNQPVSVAVDASNWGLYSSGILSDCTKAINHGVLVVGWGQNDSGNQYWKIKNSWGDSWGQRGFIRLAMGDTCAVCDYVSFPNL